MLVLVPLLIGAVSAATWYVDDGIDLDDSEYNTIANNNVFNNSDDGMDIEHSFNNTLINNTVCLNTESGIKLKNSSNNKIYNNNLIYNDEQPYADSNNNTWDNGLIIGGNYWGDHKCVGNPSNGSQPYYIGSNGIDHYPFEDPIGELPPLPPPVPKTGVWIDKTERLYTSETYIDHNQLYNFDIEWYVGVWDVKHLDNVIASCIGFDLPDKTVQDKPWADMVVNTMDEDGYTLLNVSIIPRKPSVSVGLNIWGDFIIYSCPPEFDGGKFLPDSRIAFHGDWEDLNQGQSYNFSILVDEPKEVMLWLETNGGGTEYSETLTFLVSELGSVTVAYDVPVKWDYMSTYPKCAQSITLEF
ncbi:copper-binding protein (NosD) [Methanophagales archaeon]|nr:copper-binding protein (NosD) [Methanophagales archaeon]